MDIEYIIDNKSYVIEIKKYIFKIFGRTTYNDINI